MIIFNGFRARLFIGNGCWFGHIWFSQAPSANLILMPSSTPRPTKRKFNFQATFEAATWSTARGSVRLSVIGLWGREMAQSKEQIKAEREKEKLRERGRDRARERKREIRRERGKPKWAPLNAAHMPQLCAAATFSQSLPAFFAPATPLVLARYLNANCFLIR